MKLVSSSLILFGCAISAPIFSITTTGLVITPVSRTTTTTATKTKTKFWNPQPPLPMAIARKATATTLTRPTSYSKLLSSSIALASASASSQSSSTPATSVVVYYRFQIDGLWQQLPSSGCSSPFGMQIKDCFTIHACYCSRDGDRDSDGGGSNNETNEGDAGGDEDDSVKVSCVWIDDDDDDNSNTNGYNSDRMSALFRVEVDKDATEDATNAATATEDEDEILVCITAKQYEGIEFFKATLSHVNGTHFNHMIDPKLNDPYPVIQSTILVTEEEGAEEGKKKETTCTKYSRVYQKYGLSNMLSYKQNDIVASVRLVTTRRC